MNGAIALTLESCAAFEMVTPSCSPRPRPRGPPLTRRAGTARVACDDGIEGARGRGLRPPPGRTRRERAAPGAGYADLKTPIRGAVSGLVGHARRGRSDGDSGVTRSAFELPHVEHGDDVRVVERRGELRLAKHGGRRLGVRVGRGDVRREDLEHDRPLQTRIMRPITSRMPPEPRGPSIT